MENNNSEWWDNFWQESQIVQDREWKKLMLDLQSEHLRSIYKKITPGNKFIECGCGEGNISKKMSSFGYHCTLLDYSESALRKSKENFINISDKKKNFIVGNLNELPINNNSYDIVFSGGVLEYSNDLEKWIYEMSRILKPGGVFSATIFPKKFSIQTLAHFFNTPASILNNLYKKNFHKAFKFRTSFPKNYPINKYKINDYYRACKKANIDIIKCGGSNPFFRLDLPRKIENAYAKFLTQRMNSFYRNFNSRDNLITNTLGITYDIIGIKNSS